MSLIRLVPKQLRLPLFDDEPAAVVTIRQRPILAEWIEQYGITRAEQQVLELVIQDFKNRVIALRLERSEATVRAQISSMLKRTGLESRTALAVSAITPEPATPVRKLDQPTEESTDTPVAEADAIEDVS
jgi:DNA-binding NarL/FixJ family response regulator